MSISNYDQEIERRYHPENFENTDEELVFEITVYNDFFKKEFKGTFIADSEEQAIKDAKDFYAYELDTFEDSIEIINIKQILDK